MIFGNKKGASKIEAPNNEDNYINFPFDELGDHLHRC